MSFKFLSGMRSRKLVTGAGTSLGWCKAQVASHHPTSSSYYANWYQVNLQRDSCNTRNGYGYGLAHHVADQSRKFHKWKVMTNHDESPVAQLSSASLLLDKGMDQHRQSNAAMESKLQCHQANESCTWDQTSDHSACPLAQQCIQLAQFRSWGHRGTWQKNARSSQRVPKEFPKNPRMSLCDRETWRVSQHLNRKCHRNALHFPLPRRGHPDWPYLSMTCGQKPREPEKMRFFFPKCRSTNSRFDNVQYMPAYPSPSLMESTRMWRSITWHAFLKRFWGKNGAPNLEDVACSVGYANCFSLKGRLKQQVTKHGPTWPGSQVSFEINKPHTHTHMHI